MIKLLFLRVVPLMLRPAAVFLEGTLVSDKYVLVLLLPVAMMALTISSIPVYLEYFRSHPGQTGHALLARRYISSLSWLTLLSLLVLFGVLLFLPLGFGPILIGATCFTFAIKKNWRSKAREHLSSARHFCNGFSCSPCAQGGSFCPLLPA